MLPVRLASLIPLLLVGGCAASSDYPSLAPRPIEDVSLAEPAARPAPAGTDPAAARARYAPLVAQAGEADRAFRATVDRERGALERGHDAAMGSDAWAAAQQALSRVQAARAPVQRLLSTLTAAIEEPEARVDTGIAAAADHAAQAVRAIDASERDTLARLTPRAGS